MKYESIPNMMNLDDIKEYVQKIVHEKEKYDRKNEE